jgi:RNA polymerase sigma factor (sigma-70 family)
MYGVMRRFERWPDGRLLEAARNGEAEAFGVFFSRHSEVVLVFLRRRVGSPELAADLTAETFAGALLAVHRGHAREVTNGAAWLLGIARHKLVDSYRRGHAQNEARGELGIPAIAVEDAELARIDELAGAGSPVHAALERLSPQEREAIVQRVLLERDYEQIAREIGETQAVVRKRVSRGLARLREGVEERGR